MRARKVDANQPEIVAAFRKLGCSWIHLHTVGAGVMDGLCGYGGICVPVEIKTENGKDTAAQIELMDTWTGGRFTVRNDEDVTRIVEMLKRWHRLISEGQMK